jgi:hypothetical protein
VFSTIRKWKHPHIHIHHLFTNESFTYVNIIDQYSITLIAHIARLSH